MNKIILSGRLIADPMMHNTQNNVSVCSFTIAVDRKYSKEKQVDFINCVAWRQNAEFISKYFKKGKLIAIEGFLQSRSYKANDGTDRTIHEVVVEAAEFAGENK